MTAPLQILIIDDDLGDRKLLRRLLAQALPDAQLREAADLLPDPEAEAPDLLLLDHLLPGRSGLDLIAEVTALWPRAAVVLMTGQGSEELAASAIQQGAVDYVAKRSLTEEALRRIVQHGLETADLRWRVAEQRREQELFCEVLIHDFRAPIRAVGFLSETLIEEAETADRAEILSHARLLLKSARQMGDLITSLSTHIRLDHDGFDLHDAALTDILDRALTAIQREICDSGAAIEADLGDLTVHGNAPALAQVLQNLIGNAIKYTYGRQPRIRVSARLEDRLLLTIADNGVGVPPDQTLRIFDPFLRLTATMGTPGTGLGLATCRKLIERHGGTIWCTPGASEGTVFHIALPRSAAETGPILANLIRDPPPLDRIGIG